MLMTVEFRTLHAASAAAALIEQWITQPRPAIHYEWLSPLTLRCESTSTGQCRELATLTALLLGMASPTSDVQIDSVFLSH